MKKVWRIPWLTHSDFIPMLADTMSPKLMFEKRAIKFANQLLNSNNYTVNVITGMALYGSHSVLGQNIKYLSYKYNLDINCLFKCWNDYCNDNSELIRQCEQIKELCRMRDSYYEDVLNRPEAKFLIDELCTE